MIKHIFTALYCSLLTVFATAQTTCDFDKLFREGQSYARQRQYEKALYKYNSARRCNPKNGEKIDQAISAMFKKVEAEKDSADQLRVRAESALTDLQIAQRKNEKIIHALYFYEDRFALAVKNKYGQNKYGFIDKEGNTTIPYEFDEALPFDDKIGYAKVKIDDTEYLIDTTGRQYELASNLDDVNEYTEALDLRSLNLKAIPDSVFTLKQLRILLLADNNITILPDKIAELDSLQALVLSENNIRSLPDGLGSLDSLKLLNLSGNNLNSLPESLQGLQALKVLNISGNALQNIPTAVLSLPNLTYLNASNIGLTKLSAGIKNLKNLCTLDISENELQSLPSEIGDLSQLKYLSCSDNELDVLPPSIGSLSQLVTLNISSNNLETLPIEILNLKKLEYFNPDSNQILDFPLKIFELPRLRKISVVKISSLNSFSKLCNALGMVRKPIFLTIDPVESWEEPGALMVTMTVYKEIPPEIAIIKSLVALNLSKVCVAKKVKTRNPPPFRPMEEDWEPKPPSKFNAKRSDFKVISGTPLKPLPIEMRELSQLRYLKLSVDGFKLFPSVILTLQNLETLDISSNQMQSIPIELAQLKNLRHLDISSNPLNEVEIKNSLVKAMPWCKIAL